MTEEQQPTLQPHEQGFPSDLNQDFLCTAFEVSQQISVNCLKYLPKASGFPDSQLVKNVPAMSETWVQSLGWEDPLEKGKATHSSIPAWRISWTV